MSSDEQKEERNNPQRLCSGRGQLSTTQDKGRISGPGLQLCTSGGPESDSPPRPKAPTHTGKCQARESEPRAGRPGQNRFFRARLDGTTQIPDRSKEEKKPPTMPSVLCRPSAPRLFLHPHFHPPDHVLRFFFVVKYAAGGLTYSAEHTVLQTNTVILGIVQGIVSTPWSQSSVGVHSFQRIPPSSFRLFKPQPLSRCTSEPLFPKPHQD